jgi:hypothetical protein
VGSVGITMTVGPSAFSPRLKVVHVHQSTLAIP